jgi:hypothetical protein
MYSYHLACRPLYLGAQVADGEKLIAANFVTFVFAW